MAKKPGDTFGFQFATYSATGALQAADSLPTGKVVRNGVDDATPPVAITNLTGGLYSATGTIPSGYAVSDEVQVRINATVGGVASGALRDYRSLNDLSLALPITDVKTATVGGALNGAWATGWGKSLKDIAAKLLKVWGAGNATGTPSATFTLDDGTNPTSRTPQ